MAGTKAGGLAAAKTNKARFGENFYANIGRAGGKLGRTGGFASSKIGADGLTGHQRAHIAGTKGGSISKRRGSSPKHVKELSLTKRLTKAFNKAKQGE